MRDELFCIGCMATEGKKGMHAGNARPYRLGLAQIARMFLKTFMHHHYREMKICFQRCGDFLETFVRVIEIFITNMEIFMKTLIRIIEIFPCKWRYNS